MIELYEFEIANSAGEKLRRGLRMTYLPNGLRIARFMPLGDPKLCEFVGKELAKRIPAGTQALLMPDGKAQAILHVMGRESGLPTYVARKEHKPYMGDVIEGKAHSVTSTKVQPFYLMEEDAREMAYKKVALFDDVVSSGSTIEAMRDILSQIERVTETGVLCVATEGDLRPDVISLTHLPISGTLNTTPRKMIG